MSNAWVESWDVLGTSGKTYKVSRREDDSFGCNCPAWMFQKKRSDPLTGEFARKDCQHILKIKLEQQLKLKETVALFEDRSGTYSYEINSLLEKLHAKTISLVERQRLTQLMLQFAVASKKSDEVAEINERADRDVPSKKEKQEKQEKKTPIRSMRFD